MVGYISQFQKLWKTRTTAMVLLIMAVVFFFIGFQNFELSSGSSSLSLFSIFRLTSFGKDFLPSEVSSSISSNSTSTVELPHLDSNGDSGNESEEVTIDTDDLDLGKDEHLDDEFVFDIGNGTMLKRNKDGHLTLEKNKDLQVVHVLPPATNNSSNSTLGSSKSRSRGNVTTSPPPSQTDRSKNEAIPPKPEVMLQMQNGSAISNSTFTSKPAVEKKRRQQVLGVWTMSDMDRVLDENHASSHAMTPRWSSEVDRQMSYAKAGIEKAPILKSDPELYAAAFRNLSVFKRSYELMEQMLKVYVYKEGERPIFHKPFFTGIYASEGWFMKQMEENTQFVVDDPEKAHLFYLPFSSRILQHVLYVANSHSHRNLIARLVEYVNLISSKYPFWNRTGGADHFLAACHDWATHETGVSMPTTIRALCNADVRIGFEIGKDVSLPETNVENGRDPLHNLGGKPAKKRTTLAFFAGQMHGYLRPILVEQWQNKDPRMIISGPIPHRIKQRTKKKKSTTTYPYMEHMKDSRYCICPRGYEVNSPRVVEAIFYGCVPVIISDNFVPPFFELLDWSAFSILLEEKDLPRLKEVLVGIPDRRYLELERGVRGVRKHFLWNKKPLKYDLFHMILHNVWFNRLHQIGGATDHR